MTNQERGEHYGKEIQRKNGLPPLELTHLLGSGGEGNVYAVAGEPTLAVKIYKPERMPTGAAAQKLTAMENIQIKVKGMETANIPPLAWPQQVIKEIAKDQVVGLVMPRVDKGIAPPISHILTPTTRKITLRKHGTSEGTFLKMRWKIAKNLTTVVEAIHDAGCVIGDVNDENILTNPATGEISIVDCDAFQIADKTNKIIHRCRVGRPDYTPPELLEQINRATCTSATCRKAREQGRHKPDYSCLDRLPSHDMFGISVIIFKLFMEGAHPFTQRNSSGTGATGALKNLIEQRRYPYDLHSAKANVTKANADRYRNLPIQLRTIFHRTFS